MSMKQEASKAEWYFNNAGTQEGPVTSSQLRTLARSGTITADTLVWKQGLPDWVQASEINGLNAVRTARTHAPASEVSRSMPLSAGPAPQAVYNYNQPRQEARVPGERVARTAGWLGFAGIILLPPLVLVGLILSIIALSVSRGKYGASALVLNLVVAPAVWITVYLIATHMR
jgi:hypothetical protein